MNKSPQLPIYRPVIDKILNRLAEAKQPLPSSLEFYHHILNVQIKNKLPDLSDISIQLETKAKQNLSQGKPVLTFSDLKIDWESFQKLYNELSTLTVESLEPAVDDIDELKQICVDIKSFKEAAKTWFGSKTLSRESLTKHKNVHPLASSIFQAAFYPLLSTYADKLLSLVPQDSWYKKYCPICGGGPDFGFLDKEEDGARWLLCSRCDAKWLFYRLVCPHCGNDDQKTLAYFTDDAGLYRLYVCEKCRRYLKVLDLRKTEAEILLPLERILTLDLDRQAHESNYKAE
jgi:FdhE protein